MINGLPSPTLLCFLAHETPQLIYLCGFHVMNFYFYSLWMNLLTHGTIHMVQFGLFFLMPESPYSDLCAGPVRYRESHGH